MIQIDTDTPVYAAYERIKDLVGSTETTLLSVVRSIDFQRFAVAAGDPNPIFVSDEEARNAGHPAAVAPPLFLSSVMGWEAGPREGQLMPDGTTAEDVGFLPLGGLRLMGAGQELEFLRDVTEGTEVTREKNIESIDLKEGGTGPLIFIGLTKRYFDSNGNMLMVCKENFIGR